MPDAASPYAIRDNVEKHRFEIDLGDGNFAIADYVLHPGKIMFTHTEVPPAHQGKGLGTALVKFALASARERGLKVVPICPFFAAYFRKHPEEQDLLDPAYRKVLGLD
jgi:predicted GNAT family acetyltransferase